MSNDETAQNSFIAAPIEVIHPMEYRPSLGTAFVYGIKSLDLIKVGVAKNVKKRLFAICGHNPHGCELVFKRYTIAPYLYEDKMHELLAEHAVGREWFRVSVEQVKEAAKIASLHARRHWRSVSEAYVLDRVAELRERQAAENSESRQRHSAQLINGKDEGDQNVA